MPYLYFFVYLSILSFLLTALKNYITLVRLILCKIFRINTWNSWKSIPSLFSNKKYLTTKYLKATAYDMLRAFCSSLIRKKISVFRFLKNISWTTPSSSLARSIPEDLWRWDERSTFLAKSAYFRRPPNHRRISLEVVSPPFFVEQEYSNGKLDSVFRWMWEVMAAFSRREERDQDACNNWCSEVVWWRTSWSRLTRVSCLPRRVFSCCARREPSIF